ncbi:M48 family metallopeptidase [Craterilacuibacter sinensis]|uniref:M48 family metalloprotease n=1 Tax=Craterilacuibacter sinensis TaxID=2686017 RepID=A0A845BHY7_9NEIS|nr:M48 family metallopeptidase [Craterilacuibacter sinensis]MXR35915.1 M48 family metalloprotease [Craterilacuibacter sinensis]
MGLRKSSAKTVLLAVAASLLLGACQSTTMGGAVGAQRKQLLLVSSAEVNAGSAQAYQQNLLKARNSQTLNSNKAYTRRVKDISARLIRQVAVYRPDAASWNWEVNVFTSPEVNAYCMPGGKIGVYSGIIDQLQLNDDELAAIIGHEIAHALREHSREKISQDVAQRQGLALVGALAGLSQGQMDMANMAGQYALTLPFSRGMETEADVMGLELMARAGYRPDAAVSVWRKMARLGGGGPEFMSTHPSGSTRIAELSAHIPQVMPLYEAALRKR